MCALGQRLAGTVVFGGDRILEAAAESGGAASCVLPACVRRVAPAGGTGLTEAVCPASLRAAGNASGLGHASAVALGVVPVVVAFSGQGLAEAELPWLLRVGETIAEQGLAHDSAQVLLAVGAKAQGEGRTGALAAGVCSRDFRMDGASLAWAGMAPGVLLHSEMLAFGQAEAEAGATLGEVAACDASGRSQAACAGYPTYMGGVSVQFRADRTYPLIVFSEVFS